MADAWPAPVASTLVAKGRDGTVLRLTSPDGKTYICKEFKSPTKAECEARLLGVIDGRGAPKLLGTDMPRKRVYIEDLKGFVPLPELARTLDLGPDEEYPVAVQTNIEAAYSMIQGELGVTNNDSNLYNVMVHPERYDVKIIDYAAGKMLSKKRRKDPATAEIAGANVSLWTLMPRMKTVMGPSVIRLRQVYRDRKLEDSWLYTPVMQQLF